jgi:CRP/FNR family transcriptional regulator, cyclic AMP receptor protein
MSIANSFKKYTDFESFTGGDIIFKEGDPGEVMYAVIEGEVDLKVNDKVIYTVGAGEVLGEMALIDKKPRSATAVAKTPCKLVIIDEKRFTFLIQQTPMFVTQIMKVMADRLRMKNDEVGSDDEKGNEVNGSAKNNGASRQP